MTEPEISVVVATYRRADRLPRLVAALEAQEGAPPFEVLVVDDGSPDDTFTVLEKLAANATIPLRPLKLDRNRGPASARNLGWRAASAPLVAFTDDDCAPRPGWLAALHRRLAEADLVQGLTRPDQDEWDARGPFSRTLWVSDESGFYETCNMAYRREVLERLGGFDERYRHPYGEDADLAWRAKTAGCTSTFAAEAVVHHDVTPSDWRARLREARRLEGVVLNVRDHPWMRDRLHRRWFQRPSHPPALLALAGAVVALSRPRSPVRWLAGAALGAPYLWHRTRGGDPAWCRRRDWPVVLPQMLAVDLLDVGVLAKASAKHRTFLL